MDCTRRVSSLVRTNPELGSDLDSMHLIVIQLHD
jgi:hypothetical protein